MSRKCNACGRFGSAADGVKCTRCSSYYHKNCVNIPTEAAAAAGWLCPDCKAHTPRKDNTENPVRGEKADYVDIAPQNASSCGSCSEMLKEIKLLNANMMSIKNDLRSMKEDVNMLRGTIECFSGRLDIMESRLDCLENKQADQTSTSSSQVSGLLTTIEELKTQLNDREQEAFCNDFEISCVPEEPGESAGHLVARIAEKLGVAYDERDLVLAERVGVRRAPLAADGAPAPPLRPRPLVVRLARHSLRDAFLQAARVRRNITTDGLGLTASPIRFYVNERLSKYNKNLFFKLRTISRTNNWKYAWTREGRLYVRREMGRAAFRVRSEQDLTKIFGNMIGEETRPVISSAV